MRRPPLYHDALAIAQTNIQQRLAVVRIRHLPVLVEQIHANQFNLIPGGLQQSCRDDPQLHYGTIAGQFHLHLLGDVRTRRQVVRNLEGHRFTLHQPRQGGERTHSQSFALIEEVLEQQQRSDGLGFAGGRILLVDDVLQHDANELSLDFVALVRQLFGGVQVQLSQELCCSLNYIVFGAVVDDVPQETNTNEGVRVSANLVLKIRLIRLLLFLLGGHGRHLPQRIDGGIGARLEQLERANVLVDALHHGLEGVESIQLQ